MLRVCLSPQARTIASVANIIVTAIATRIASSGMAFSIMDGEQPSPVGADALCARSIEPGLGYKIRRLQPLRGRRRRRLQPISRRYSIALQQLWTRDGGFR